MTAPAPLTVEQLHAMPAGTSVISGYGDVYTRTNTAWWATGNGWMHSAEYLLARCDVIPLHLSAEELNALPSGATVVAEDGDKWTTDDDGRIWTSGTSFCASDSIALSHHHIDRRTVALPPAPEPEPEPEPVGLTAEQIQALPAGTILIDSDGDKWATLPVDKGAATSLAYRFWRNLADLVEAYGPIQTAMLPVDEIRDAHQTNEWLTDALGHVWRPKGLTGSDRWGSEGVLVVDSQALAAIGVPRTPAPEGDDQ